MASNKKIAKLIAINTPDMYDKPTVPSVSYLMQNNIKTYGYDPEIKSEIGTYITIRPSAFGSIGGHYDVTDVLINIFTHDDLQTTNYGNRLLLLCDELRKEFADKRVAIGKLILDRGGITPNLKSPYNGYWFSCRIIDFSR